MHSNPFIRWGWTYYGTPPDQREPSAGNHALNRGGFRSQQEASEDARYQLGPHALFSTYPYHQSLTR